METLNRSDYNVPVVGSDKIYYGSYPYRVKLKDNEITASWEVTADILSWRNFGEESYKRKFGSKSVSNWTKNYYFTGKSLLDSFVNHIGDHNVDRISGPVSDYHSEMLEMVSREDRYGSSVHVIKGNKYFNKYDMKLVWQYPYRAHRANSVYNSKPLSNSAYFDKLGKSIEGVCDSRYYDRNVYFNEENLEDIEFFCKLKYGDIISSRVKVIVIDNM